RPRRRKIPRACAELNPPGKGLRPDGQGLLEERGESGWRGGPSHSLRVIDVLARAVRGNPLIAFSPGTRQNSYVGTRILRRVPPRGARATSKDPPIYAMRARMPFIPSEGV